MAWREITVHGGIWKVHPAAERRPYANAWQLMLSFSSCDEADPTRFWAPYPIQADSRTSLFVQAERIEDDELRALVTEHAAS